MARERVEGGPLWPPRGRPSTSASPSRPVLLAVTVLGGILVMAALLLVVRLLPALGDLAPPAPRRTATTGPTADVPPPPPASTTTTPVLGEDLFVRGRVVAVPTADGAPPTDIVTGVSGPGDEDAALVRYGPDGAVWRTEIAPDVEGRAGRSIVGIVGDLVVTDWYDTAHRIAAYDLADGRERWRTDEEVVEGACVTCLAQVGDVLVSWTRSGHVVGLDPATGRVIWEVVEAERTAVVGPAVVGDAVATLVVRPEGSDLVVADVATGAERSRRPVSCRGDRFEPGLVRTVPGTTDVVLASDAGCVQRWPTGAGASGPVWSTVLPGPSIEPSGAAVSADRLVVPNRGAGSRLVDLGDGSSRDVPIDGYVDRAGVTFVAVVGASVVGTQVDGSGRTAAVVGWGGGEPWRVEAPEVTSVTATAPVPYDGQGPVLVVRGDQVDLVAADTLDLTVAIDPETGATTPRPPVDVRLGQVGMATLAPQAVVGDALLVVVDGIPALVDPSTGTALTTWSES